MKEYLEKRRKRIQRKRYIRGKIQGTTERPRMTVFKSNKNLSIQVIDDSQNKTLISASTLEKDLKDLKSNVVGGTKLGQIIGARLKEANINTVVFDRNGFKYHGVIKAIADEARKSGIEF